MNLMTRIWLKILKEWWQFYVPIRLRGMGVVLGKDARFYGMPIVRMTKGSSIFLGDRVVLCSDSRFTDLGVNHPVVLRTLRPGAKIAIGNDCGISGGSICAAISVTIGNECLLGANVTIADTDFHAIKPAGRRFNANPADIGTVPINIADNVFIGTGAVVLKGVSIGSNSVIGAMTTVNKNVQSNVVMAGAPARFVKEVKYDL